MHPAGLPARLVLGLIRLYQATLSRLLRATIGNVCRFEPSCSSYAATCVERQGVIHGGLLSFVRLSKCTPFHAGGYDPPPPPRPPRSSLLTSAAPDGDHPAG